MSYQLKTNTIYCGDNLKMLKDIPSEAVDLIYIDPPFNSNRNYEVFWGDTQEKRAFNDRFGDAQAYINYMQPRVVELYRVLKKTGSFYYHCDWHASHYIKVMLDQIFGFNNFQNEINWHFNLIGGNAKKYEKAHETIFYYVKGNDYTFNKDKVREPYSDGTLRGAKQDEDGNLIYTSGLGRDGDRLNRKKNSRINPLGKSPSDVWTMVKNYNPTGDERLGYPTQKPIALLERILLASSNEGDVVLDAFCGCGTTLVAAQKLKRNWLGIDISPTACRVMADRLYKIFKIEEGKDFFVRDLQKSEEELMQLPHFEFQNWAVIALGGIPNQIKSGDFGIDGKLYPIEITKKKKDEKDLFGDKDIYYPIQVKQKEKAGRPDIDSFETAIKRDGRRKGYFIAFDFTQDAIKEIQRLDKEGEIEIIPITVKYLLRKEK